MVLRVWENLLKFLLMRLSIQLGESLRSAYRLGVGLLRKATPRLIPFRWLQNVINSLLPCPQMVQRYIDPEFVIEDFFSLLNKRGIRYTILRWFEDLPNLKQGDDIDMLVHDDDLAKIKDLFVVLPTGTPCDIYSVWPLPGSSYRKGVAYYPSHIAQEILDTSIRYKDIYRVPDPKHHFLSLAYHAVYHKAEESRLAYSQDKPLAAVDGESSYSEKLVALGEACDVKVSPDLQSLHQLLTEQGWTPRIDVLRRIAIGSSWLTSLVHETLSGKAVSSETLRYPLNIHGLRMIIESDCPVFMEYLWRDFCYFRVDEGNYGDPAVRINFLNKEPPWKEITPQTVPLFKTETSTVYKVGPNRYVDHDGEVLVIYDLKRDQGTVYSLDPDAMYRIAYGIIMTRVGCRLDRAGYHRLEALGVSVEDAAFLLLARGGCGKTTLGFELMKNPQVTWLTDDILVVDSAGGVLAFPTSPRLIEGSVVPWLPPAVNLLKAPMPIYPPKVQIPSASILPRVRASAKIRGIFLCMREAGVGPTIKRVGFFAALMGICKNGFDESAFAKRLAYQLRFSPAFLFQTAAIYLSRVRSFVYLAWKVAVYRFEMGGQISENASRLLNMWAAMSDAKDLAGLNSFNDSSASDPSREASNGSKDATLDSNA